MWAAFLLTIGGILTYVAFNPGSIDGRPHSALSHIPHFHHHTHHAPHPADGHHLGYHHPTNNHLNTLHNSSHHHTATQSPENSTPAPPPTVVNASTHNISNIIGNSSTPQDEKIENNHTSSIPHHNNQQHNMPTNHHNETSSETSFRASYEAKATQSLVLAIIGPLCLLMGILVTLIVGVMALKYDCDHEPEPNIAFLRLRSEMSLNFDPDKNNYELLRPMPSSSIAENCGTFSINPTGLSEGGS